MKLMKPVLTILALLLILSLPLLAQDQPAEKFVAGGVGLASESTSHVAAFGAFAYSITDRIAAWTAYRLVTVKEGESSQIMIGHTRVQSTVRPGIGIKIANITDRFTLGGLANAGVAIDADNVVGSFGAGGYVDIAFGRGWGALVVLQVDKDSMVGRQFTPIIAIRKRI